MVISKEKLLSAMKQALPGVDSGTTLIEGADCFVFQDGMIYTFNDYISVCIPFATDEPLAGSVKAVDFYALINKFSDNEIKLATSEDSWLIKSGTIKVEFTLLKFNTIEYIMKIRPEDASWKEIPSNFFEFMKYSIFKGSNSSLSGVYVNGSKVVSTDEMRINLFNLDTEMDTFWISNQSAMELIKINDLKEYSITKAWVHFRNKDGVLFSCKRLNQEKYPFDTIVKLVKNHEKSDSDISGKLPDGLYPAIDRASSLSMSIEFFNAIKLEFTNSHIIVSSERVSGKYQEKVQWTEKPSSDFEPISIIIDYNMIENGLSLFKEFYLKTIDMKGKESTHLVFKGNSGLQLVGTLQKDK